MGTGILIFIIAMAVFVLLLGLWAVYSMIYRPRQFIPGFTYQDWRFGSRS
jgi:hypothetical protein